MTSFADLQGKRVLIIGASTGIGAAVARGFARCGAQVGIHYNASKAPAETLAKEIGAAAKLFSGDVTKSAAVEKTIKDAAAAFGGLDIVINNAGSLVKRTPYAETNDAFYDAIMDLNVRAVVTGCRVAADILKKQGTGGNIINTGSIAARNGGGPGSQLYASAKSFVQNLTRGLAKEYAADKIRVNAVAPGVIMTPFHERHSKPDVLETMRKTIPMARLGTPEECVGAYLFLASDALSGYITGQVIEVNGGQLMP